jgi:RHS repeat-associated protein
VEPDRLETRTFDPYGQPLASTGTPQTPFGFTGELADANGLLYLRARHYAPRLGAFPSLDPYEGSAARPMSLNGYAWVEGNVANAVDPSGSCTLNASSTNNQRNQCSDDPRCVTGARNAAPPCASTRLDECDIRYLAHVSAAEATGTRSNEVMAAIMLSQINRYNQAGGNF